MIYKWSISHIYGNLVESKVSYYRGLVGNGFLADSMVDFHCQPFSLVSPSWAISTTDRNGPTPGWSPRLLGEFAAAPIGRACCNVLSLSTSVLRGSAGGWCICCGAESRWFLNSWGPRLLQHFATIGVKIDSSPEDQMPPIQKTPVECTGSIQKTWRPKHLDIWVHLNSRRWD